MSTGTRGPPDDRRLHRWHGWHQTGAGFAAGGCARKISPSSSTPATTSSGGACTFRPTSIPFSTGSRACSAPTAAGAWTTTPSAVSNACSSSGSHRGSRSAISIWRRTSRARRCSRAGKSLSQATAELAVRARNSRARAAHVRRPRLDHARHRQRHADISGVFCARAASDRS